MSINNALTSHNFNLYEYICDTLTITCASKQYPIQSLQILSMYIERDYDNDHLPVFMMQLLISDDLYHKICNNHKDTTFTMKMKSQISLSESEKTAGSLYINGSFEPIGIDGTPYESQKLYDSAKEKSTTGENAMMTDFSRARTFVLCNKQQLAATKKIHNWVLSSASMTDAVAALLSESGAIKPLMSPMDNSNRYSELLLLPQPLIPQLKYLNSFYGFYKEGAQIFFDMNYTYILRNTAKCTAYVKDEIQTVVFCIYDTSYGDSAKIGSRTDLKTKTAYISLSSMNFHIDNLSKAANEYMGTNAMIVNSDGTVSNATSSQGESYNVLSVTSHNKYLANELSLRMEEMSCVVYLSLVNIDLNLLTPNKTFRIISSDTNITKQTGGLFRLVSSRTTFAKNGDHFTATTVVQLKRTDT